ncbi:transporter substrate-binding domain-containing protein [Subsaximicrobium wynnwilliamsii]|uniref:Transporter substrate-binding domain-containing protein n=1 Tax=Subsaximicrobium wynnwilliamsii TaxID=291179 RepID=A0A5C6ZEM4_9FLAO|nr:transporter substrate-binding domain-containing protein [Subsaximicrobium wynnwilliamsii]TXD82400.1 transporter substrate-binding domain-containing protein [Subsaximicrobium wynnwilliamsii]TXD88042.1 transporter substrate-binding domain-containing protein [Subsaximicrobium wynnwilliamsii]TXE02096.1 transporter substrate-binding domain-containing protein [Subsaximicrobium wynnwilliamsii]
MKSFYLLFKTYYVLFFLGLFLMSCQQTQEEPTTTETPKIKRDLAAIKKDGTLKALTVYSGTSYFLYKGQAMGYEFEMLERFAEHLDLELEIIVVKDLDELMSKLNNGEGDILAHGLTITSNRKASVAFTNYLYLTKQVLVQKKPDNWRRMHWKKLENALVHDAIELLQDTVSIRKGSSYSERIANLSDELGGSIAVEYLSGELATDEIIKQVAEGNIKYTIADNNIAKIMASYYPILDVEVPVSFSQRIAWATRKNSPELLKATNQWLDSFKGKLDYNVIYNKYFNNTRDFRRRTKSEFYSLNNDEISPYDDLIQKHAERINWDWRLVASLIYQESRFDPNNSSWANAQGLMQLMPKTAEELGVVDRNDPKQSVRGGTTYLKKIWNDFENITDSIQRTKFTMASYNCGLYHVRDAQKLAIERGLDATVWDDNVEEMIVALSLPKNYNNPLIKYGYVRGMEPYNYVNQIFERYAHYTQFIAK